MPLRKTLHRHHGFAAAVALIHVGTTRGAIAALARAAGLDRLVSLGAAGVVLFLLPWIS